MTSSDTQVVRRPAHRRPHRPRTRTPWVNGFDVKWVMSPGRPRRLEDDPGRLRAAEQRVDRARGTSFDALIHRAEQARTDAELVMKRSRRLRDPEAGSKRPPGGEPEKTARAGKFENGETRTRTGDTTIFSRVLYQLSYLAEREEG